ncbi:hypothetical protein BKE30_07845 [Alkanindiges hydrocarboniclasticus]|uniref:Uncharacterized protein n=1 Tax=Alkanindiges hydrocarboniclasticus TaxID=1907941 RepID=A0A1S8CVK9_9GAMM|nr:hypothetical protein [Alkanindiges hydrocarboniclasticus]ONG40073.1 hypothetical protein BKE30_07845 [Alkanindiges hydrocarboniclasticus]
MTIVNSSKSDTNSTQQFYQQYSANHFLPSINWQYLFSQNQLLPAQALALQTIYQVTVPLALTTLKRLNIDIFAEHEKKPQGLGLFDKLRALEPRLIEHLAEASKRMDEQVRHLIWSMMMRGGAVLVFKAWLGKVKTGEDSVDMGYFNELADLLWLQTDPYTLAEQFAIDPLAEHEHLFLFYEDHVLLDRFSNLATAELFVKLGLYDPAFLCLNDEQVREHFVQKGLISQSQVDDLMDSLNPLFTDMPQSRQRVVHFYH